MGTDGNRGRLARCYISQAIMKEAVMSKQPPVPPASRSPKGPGNVANAKGEKGKDTPPDNLAEQGHQGDIKQNTTNQGYQQDR